MGCINARKRSIRQLLSIRHLILQSFQRLALEKVSVRLRGMVRCRLRLYFVKAKLLDVIILVMLDVRIQDTREVGQSFTLCIYVVCCLRLFERGPPNRNFLNFVLNYFCHCHMYFSPSSLKFQILRKYSYAYFAPSQRPPLPFEHFHSTDRDTRRFSVS